MNYMVSKTSLPKKVAKLAVEASLIAKSRRAGHSIIVCVTDHSEYVPYTIASADADAGTITPIVQTIGESSQRLVALSAGDMIHDIVGPLGQAIHIGNFGTIVRVGGGAGMAPLYPIAKALKAVGNRAIVVAVARTKELTVLEEEFREFVDEVIIVTGDGSYGTKGLVTDGAELVIRREKADLCMTISPAIMTKFVTLPTRKYNIPTASSLNIIMVDGIGMRGACRITIGGKTRLICVDEPEFDVHQVDFGELLMCFNTYRK